jgi:hypothetical protein
MPGTERARDQAPAGDGVGEPAERSGGQRVGEVVGQAGALAGQLGEAVLVPPERERAAEHLVDDQRRPLEPRDADEPRLRERQRLLLRAHADLASERERERPVDGDDALARRRDPRRVACVEVEREDLGDRRLDDAAELEDTRVRGRGGQAPIVSEVVLAQTPGVDEIVTGEAGVRASFARQGFMAHLGAELAEVGAGTCPSPVVRGPS